MNPTDLAAALARPRPRPRRVTVAPAPASDDLGVLLLILWYPLLLALIWPGLLG